MKTPYILAALLALCSPALAQESPAQVDSSIPFRGIAQLHALRSSNKNWKAESIYPTFTARTRLTRFVNQKTSEAQRKAFSSWLAQSRKSLKEFPNALGPYEYSSGPELTYYSKSKLISLVFSSYTYTGGAHGMSILDARNFGIVNGQPKQLVLGDLFRSGTNYRTLVESKIFDRLKKNPDAAWIHDGSVKKLENSQFNNFVFEPGGLRWFFNPYEIGPYAAGIFEVKLSIRELGPGFRQELLRK